MKRAAAHANSRRPRRSAARLCRTGRAGARTGGGWRSVTSGGGDRTLTAFAASPHLAHQACAFHSRPTAPLPERPATLPAARFFHVTEHRQTDPQPGDAGERRAAWLATRRCSSDDTRPPPGSVRCPPPAADPLVAAVALPARALGQTVDVAPARSAAPARPADARRGAASHPDAPPPRLEPAHCHPRRLQPPDTAVSRRFQAPQPRPRKAPRQARDSSGACSPASPAGKPLVRKPLQSATQRWQVPPAATPLLILSDLGLLDGAPETLRGWQQVRRPPAQRRVPGAGPLPGSRAPAPASLQRCFEIVEWDRHSLLRRSLTQAPAGRLPPSGQRERRSKTAQPARTGGPRRTAAAARDAPPAAGR
jgi:hypothetical protein